MSVQKGRICTRESNDVGKRGDSAYVARRMPRAFTHKEHYYGLRCVTLDTIAVFDVLFRPVSHRQSGSSGGTHSALLRSALLPSPASSLSRELVSGRHLPLPEAVGWPRPPWLTACPSLRTWWKAYRLRCGNSSEHNRRAACPLTKSLES